MDFLTLAVLAYLVGKGMSGGANNVKDKHETTKKKLSPAKDGNKAGKGTNIAAGILTAGTAAYTFTSGFKNGWKEAWPEARETVKAQREKNRKLKEALARGDVPPGDGRVPLTKSDGAGVIPPRPPGGPGPLPPGAVPAPPSHPPAITGPATAGPVSSTLGSSPVAQIEVRSVDTLVIWLEGVREFSTREREDALAAVRRIRNLERRVDNAYNAAAAEGFGRSTLAKLAGLRERLAKLHVARKQDATNSGDAAGNCEMAAKNVMTRHGAINEAAASAPEGIAEIDAYID